jgi:hypothetical protein
MARRQAVNAKRIKIAERNKRILDLRKQGLSQGSIARSFDISTQMCGRIVREELQQITLGTAHDLKVLSTERLEQVMRDANLRLAELRALRSAEQTRIAAALTASPQATVSTAALLRIVFAEQRESVVLLRAVEAYNRLHDLGTPLEITDEADATDAQTRAEKLGRLTLDQQETLARLIRIMNGEAVPAPAIEWTPPPEDVPPKEWKQEPTVVVEPEIVEPIVIHPPECPVQIGPQSMPCHAQRIGDTHCPVCLHLADCHGPEIRGLLENLVWGRR